jgi:multidrug efflux system membrane fusion protein
VDALDREQQHTLAQGTLITLDNQINPTTGTVRARATFPNQDNELFPNQFVNARLFVKTLHKVDLVPTAAIQHNLDAAFIYLVQADSTVKSSDVKIIATEGEVSAVTGVNPGDKVVTDGFDKLQSGVKVAIRQAQATSAPVAKTE